jgi:hypothetical protein
MFSKIVLTLETQRPLARLSYRQSGPVGINKTLALIPLVTPQNRHLANYSNHATIRTMSLWKRTTKQVVHMQHARDAGGIKIVTLHKFTMEPTKEYIVQPRRLQRVKNTNTYKDPNHT